MHPALYIADIQAEGGRSLGIRQFALDLLGQLHRSFPNDNEERLSLIVSRSSIDVQAENFSKVKIPFKNDRPVSRLVIDQFHRVFLRSRKFTCYHYLKGFLPVLIPDSTPTIATVADTIVQHYSDAYPHYRSSIDLGYWIMLLKLTLRRSRVIVVPSEYSKVELHAFAERYRIGVGAVVVVPNGSVLEKEDAVLVKSNFVLHLASKAPHKRTTWLLQIWQSLQNRKLELPPLELVGELSDVSLHLASNLKNVNIRPELPREQLVDVMGQSQVLLFPSEKEGFGLPALECAYLGTPVCYPAGGAVEEVLGTGFAGAYSTHDEDSFADALNRCLQLSPDALQQMRDSVRSRFSLERSAKQMIEIYASF